MNLATFETEHYTFHFTVGSYAQAHVREAAALQEACLAYITKVLNVDFPHRIHYYLCDTPQQVGQVYGDDDPCNGFAVIPDRIYAVYNENVQCLGMHEDAHLVSYFINRPNSAALREGLAMFFDRKWWGISNMEWAGMYLQKDRIPPLRVLLDDECFFDMSDTLTYPIMGAFTEYLILTYGNEKYRKLYACKGSLTLAFAELYDRSVETLDEEFCAYLRIFRMDGVVLERMETLLNA